MASLRSADLAVLGVAIFSLLLGLKVTAPNPKTRVKRGLTSLSVGAEIKRFTRAFALAKIGCLASEISVREPKLSEIGCA